MGSYDLSIGNETDQQQENIMNRFSIHKIGAIATVILSVGAASGCEYCQTLLLAAVAAMALRATTMWTLTTASDDLIEIFSHLAH